jgi:2'-5' RNA ligase
MSKIVPAREFRAEEPQFHRLMFAFLPNDVERQSTVAAGRAVCEAERIGTPIREHLVHATLLVLLDVDTLSEALIDIYAAIGDTIAAQGFGEFKLVFDRASRNPQSKGLPPLVLVSKQGRKTFKAMQDIAVANLAKLGLPRPPHGRSKPHTTLLYGDGKVDRAIEPVIWNMKEFALVHSLVGLSEHIVLKRWKLERPLDLFNKP